MIVFAVVLLVVLAVAVGRFTWLMLWDEAYDGTTEQQEASE